MGKFDDLYKVNVSDKTEKKGNLTYLSWCWAWAEFKKVYPDANYEVKKFNGLPYVHDEKTGYMVYTSVTAEGLTYEMWLPVMDARNKTLKNAEMFDINKTIMRCLTKNLAMFGLGLYIYAGEDLPEDEQKAPREGTSAAKKTYAQCVFLKKEQDDYGISDSYEKMLQNPEFCAILEELVDFGISRYKVNYSHHYQDTNLELYQKYTYEDACRLLNWERNEVPLNIGGYKYDKKTKTFPIFINYDKQDNISDTTKYEDHFVAENRLIAISKSGRSMDSEDVQNFLNATERGIDVQLFVRKNKDDKISKEFYYLGRVIATGNAKQFVMPNTDKTAVEIEWELETPVREDIYQYIVNE